MHTYGEAVLKKDKWRLTVRPHVMIKLKRVFARLSRSRQGTVMLSNTEEICSDLRWFMLRFPLEMSENDRKRIDDRADIFERGIDEREQLLSGTVDPRAFELAIPARSYQRVAADLALRTRGLLIADDLGLGKTLSAIAMFTDPDTRPALVVCQAHLPKQWEREINRFAPQLRIHILRSGIPYDIAQRRHRKRKTDQMDLIEPAFPDVIISSYHKLRGWVDAFEGKIRSVTFDECQELRRIGPIRNPSKKYAAAKAIADECDYRCGLSATPIFNLGGEMHNLMEVLRPGALGTREEFSNEWCNRSYQEFDKRPVKDPKAFGSYLREQGLMIRRTRADVGRELPDLVKVPHHVDSDAEALDQVADSVAELARLVLDDSTKWEDRGQATRELDWRLRQATGIAKAPHVASLVKMLIGGGSGKVVLAGWHRTVYEIWLDLLKPFKPVLYTGSETAAGKQKSFDAFVSGDSQILIISLRSGSGLDGLQGVCNTVVHGELDWSPAVHDQVTGRLHRDGQGQHVVAYYALADSGSDPVIAEVLGVKREQINGVVDPDRDSFERLQTDGGHLRRMAEVYLEKTANE